MVMVRPHFTWSWDQKTVTCSWKAKHSWTEMDKFITVLNEVDWLSQKWPEKAVLWPILLKLMCQAVFPETKDSQCLEGKWPEMAWDAPKKSWSLWASRGGLPRPQALWDWNSREFFGLSGLSLFNGTIFLCQASRSMVELFCRGSYAKIIHFN